MRHWRDEIEKLSSPHDRIADPSEDSKSEQTLRSAIVDAYGLAFSPMWHKFKTTPSKTGAMPPSFSPNLSTSFSRPRSLPQSVPTWAVAKKAHPGADSEGLDFSLSSLEIESMVTCLGTGGNFLHIDNRHRFSSPCGNAGARRAPSPRRTLLPGRRRDHSLNPQESLFRQFQVGSSLAHRHQSGPASVAGGPSRVSLRGSQPVHDLTA